MAEITRETILQALGGVRKTDGGQDVVQFVGMCGGADHGGGHEAPGELREFHRYLPLGLVAPDSLWAGYGVV